MCWTRIAEPRNLAAVAAVALCLRSAGLSAQQPVPQERTPFTIENAAHFYQRRDSSGAERLILEGNVRIVHGTSRISCSKLTYFTTDRYFLCLDSVHLVDPDREVRADTLLYFVDQGHYRALGNLRWESEGMRGSGLQGDYYRNEQRLVVCGRASARDSLRLLTADELIYEYSAQVLRANGNVRLEDQRSGSVVEAANGIYRRSDGTADLTGRPTAAFYEESDTLRRKPYYLTGDRIRAFGADSAAAAGRVRLWEDSLVITADSLFHDRSSGRNYLRGGPPKVESPSYSLRGRIMDVFLRGRRLETVVAVDQARGDFYSLEQKKISEGSTPDDSLEVGVWIEGDTVTVVFAPAGLDSIVSAGQAKSYLRESPQAPASYIQGGRIVLVWDQGALDRVRVTEGGRGIYLSPDTTTQMLVKPESAPNDSIGANRINP